MFVPAVAAVLILGLREHPDVREGVTLVASGVVFVCVVVVVQRVLAGEAVGLGMGTLVPGVAFAFEVDALGALFALLASGLWIVTSLYNIGYMRGLNEHKQTRYFASFAASIATTLGVAFAENLVTLFVFYELLTVVTYPLVVHDETEEARVAGRKYLAYTFCGGIAVLAGAVLVYWLSGTTAFVNGGIAGLEGAGVGLLRVVFVLLAGGFAVKAAVMPMHAWLPDAMVAPTPVSGLLHAVAVVKSGVFGVARTILDVFGPELMHALSMHVLTAVAAGGTILVASYIALHKDNLKRRLAYSTVSQLAYIVLGLTVLHSTALVGALYHIPAHGFAKLTLFFCAGAVYVETKKKYISDMAGVGRRMPFVMIAFGVGALGMAGIPLLAGFASKFYILTGAIAMDQWLIASVYVVSGVLNIAYFWPVVSQAFFETSNEHDPKPLIENPLGGQAPRDALRSITPLTDEANVAFQRPALGRETTWFMLGPIMVTMIGSIVLGVATDTAVFMRLAELAIEAVMPA